MKTFLAIFLILPLMMAAMAIPNANAQVIENLYADGPDTSWGLVVGTVTVSDDGTDISIVYSVGAEWNITEVHCHVAADEAGIPQTGSCNPKPGKFDCNVDFAAGSEPTTYTCTLPIGDLTGNITVACHASVQLDESALPTSDPDLMKYTVDGAGEVAVPETAWAADWLTGASGADGTIGEHQFDGRNWATYFDYDLGT